MQNNIVMERQWRGGGSSAPRGSDARSNVAAAYITPMLPPPRWRRKQRQDAALSKLAEIAAGQQQLENRMSALSSRGGSLNNDGPHSRKAGKMHRKLALDGSHPLLLSAKHSPATIQEMRDQAVARSAGDAGAGHLRRLEQGV